tara:strand:- start:18319 stop:18678 length:360 start_codon:yes stop_codon:yes gene_type:complete
MKKLRELLVEIAAGKGFIFDSDDDENLEETLRLNCRVVSTEINSEHRWRTELHQVCELDGRFFGVSNYTAKTIEGDAESCGYEFEGIDNIPELFAVEVMTTAYVKDRPAHLEKSNASSN